MFEGFKERENEQTEHMGSPVVIVCPPVRKESVRIEGEYEPMAMAKIRISEENPLCLTFLQNGNSIEEKLRVLTVVKEHSFMTRELTASEYERFLEAYEGGQLVVEVGKMRMPIRPK